MTRLRSRPEASISRAVFREGTHPIPASNHQDDGLIERPTEFFSQGAFSSQGFAIFIGNGQANDADFFLGILYLSGTLMSCFRGDAGSGRRGYRTRGHGW